MAKPQCDRGAAHHRAVGRGSPLAACRKCRRSSIKRRRP
jgi:hypothetical protein